MLQSVKEAARQQRHGPGVCTADMTTEERSRWQSLPLTLSRYGASRRFGEMLRSFGFNLSTTALKKLDIDKLEDVLDRARVRRLRQLARRQRRRQRHGDVDQPDDRGGLV